MLAVNYTTARNNLKSYFDLATEKNETVIITRKADRNVVVLSLEKYNEMQKNLENALYLQKIDRGLEQIRQGKGQVHELIED